MDKMTADLLSRATPGMPGTGGRPSMMDMLVVILANQARIEAKLDRLLTKP